MNNILCTGDAGFIGSKIKERLNCDGIDFKRSHYSENIISHQHRAEYDVIIHCAAQVSVLKSVEDPFNDANNNILGTVNMLQQYPNAKFIFLSTQAVYGEGLNKKETDKVNPLSPYALSKYVCEMYIRMLSKNPLILRLSNVIGEGEDDRGETNVMTHFRNDDPIKVFGGHQIRDFINVDKVVDFICEHLDLQGLYNIGSGETIEILDLAKKMANGRKIEILPYKEGEVKKLSINIDKMRKLCS